jgi:hypothetical protein
MIAELPTARRLAMLANGYEPIPLREKVPVAVEWPTMRVDEATVRSWTSTYHDARNTGVRTRTTPVIDVDIKDAAAAEAIEALVRERFSNGAGKLLRRIGQPPKRAFLFRADAPFPKLMQDFVAPDGTKHRIEILCDGQQLAAEGKHRHAEAVRLERRGAVDGPALGTGDADRSRRERVHGGRRERAGRAGVEE